MNIFKRTIKSLAFGTLLLAILVSAAPEAFAATLNTDPQDFATLRVKNNTQQPNNTTGWNTSTFAGEGEVVSLAIYYHNTSSETATNVRVRLIPQITGMGRNHSFTAYVWADNATQVTGTANVTLSNSQSLSYVSGSTIWRPNQTAFGSQTLINGQIGAEIFTTAGLLLGDIAQGWSTQGSIVLNFQVSSGGGGPGVLPTVQTRSAQTFGSGSNSAQLNGYVNPQGTTDTSRWFEWGQNSSSLTNSTTKIGQGTNSGNFSDTVSGLSSNNTYYYRAIAKNSEGTVYGGILSFSISGTNERPFVSTNNATNITSNSAMLNCYVNPNGNSNTTRWFEYGTTQNFGNRTNTLTHGTVASNISETVFNFANNTKYYFRCVAQNTNGTSYGNVLNFTTGQGVIKTLPIAITNLATNIGQTSARINGLGTNLGNIVSEGWFEYGTNQNLNNATTRIALGSVSSNTFYQSQFGLTPNTTYYYRAVVQNTNGITRGAILNFRTNSIVVPPRPRPGPTPQLVRSVEIIKTVENLDSPNGTQNETRALRGENIRFTIEVENTGDYTLKNVNIKDRVPYYLEFANADEINVNDPQREVVWFVGDLRPNERESVTLDMVVTENARLGGIIKNVAQIETKRITRTSNEVTVIVVDNVNTTASVFFGNDSFLPNTLLEWLSLVILIFIFIVLVRKFYGYNEKRKISKEV